MQNGSRNYLEQRILHYAIVPQVAYYRNEQYVSFVSPYFRGGTLEEEIQKETENTSVNTTETPVQKTTLQWKEKIRILYQESCIPW
ncbi:hypothetical protein MAR_002885 [Mya arenaria]|uniref:Uncharacterized protein n=1 Tax=Mya arenaria TaxID=6604 RepID=A0ABY7G4E5_MYAAR|nr:hypothetical protein MAR_002885 [Mya arenaria]